jgi:hypothetical protein
MGRDEAGKTIARPADAISILININLILPI